jgi:malonyl-CoA O-methyltransferase
MTFTGLVRRLADRASLITGTRALPAREAYALWAATYPPWPHNPLMEVEQAVVAPLLQAAAPVRALDVGTGTGRYLPLLVGTGARVVIGIDLSFEMLSHDAFVVPRVRGDATSLPFPAGSFDLVCASLMAGDLPDLGAWAGEAARVLTPGGQLVYSDFHPSWTAEHWRRTFRSASGRRFELAYHPHTIDDHLSAMSGAALQVRAIREPRVGHVESPVVAVFHAVKPGVRPSGRRPH